MKLLGRMHIALLILALVNMLPAIEAEDSWGLLTVAIVSAVSSCIWIRLRGGRMPSRWLVYAGVLGATGFLLYEMFYPQTEQTVHIIDLSHFIILLCCCKFFDLHSHRDAGLIALISFLLMVISAFVTASPLFALAVLVDVSLGMAWLLRFHTEREANAVQLRQKRAIARAQRWNLPMDVTPIASDGPRVGMKRTVLACSLLLSAMAVLVFVLAPRGWRGGLFSRMHGLVPTSVTGFGDVVELTNDLLTEDEATVMRVRFSVNGRPIIDEGFQPYMRGRTFDQYFRGRWQRAGGALSRSLSDAPDDAPIPLVDLYESISPERQIQQEVWLDSIGTGALFALYPPLMFASQDIGRVNVSRRDLVLDAANSSRKATHYKVWSALDPITPRFSRAGRRSTEPVTDQSIIPDRVKELARSFIPEGVDATDRANHAMIAGRIREYLSSSDFEYTLDRGGGASKADPVTDFLFETRRGHCEYFASAMTVLCQAVGMPARLVSGFQGGELNEVGGFFQFRRKDAHAWTEVWLPDRGWTAFDPSPASAGERRRPRKTLWADIGRFVEYLRFTWSTSVVSFDSRSREELATGLATWFSNLIQGRGKTRSLTGLFKVLLWGPDFLELWQRLLYWFLMLLALVFVVLAFRVLWILSLMLREYLPARRRHGRAATRHVDAKFFDRLMLLLATKGHVRPPHVTPREFAQRLARANRDLAEVPDIVEWFYEIQYGGRSLGRQQWERVRRLLRRLREDTAFGAMQPDAGQ